MASTPPPQNISVDGEAFIQIDEGANIELVKRGLSEAVEASIKRYLYPNALFYAERLYELEGSFEHLRLLAHCHHLNQDNGTACRLLQNHYPFFRENLEKTLMSLPAGKDSEDEQLQNISDRWNCQYLLGVCCYGAKRYKDGEKVLTELIQISLSISNFAENGSIYVSSIFRSNTGTTGSSETHYNNAQHPYNLFQYKSRLAEVYHWRGLCEQHHNVDRATEAFYNSVSKNNLIVTSFVNYVKMATHPQPHCVFQLYESPQDEEMLPTMRAVRRYIIPFIKVVYLLRMYYLNEVKTLLQKPSFPSSHYGVRSTSASGEVVMHTAQRPSAWQLIHLGLALFHEGNIQSSADTFAQLLTYYPWCLHDTALVYYSTALWHLKDDSTLGALAQRLLEEIPLAATTLAVVANKYSLSKEPKEAIVMLERATQVDPLLSYAYALRGYELLYMDHKTEAGEAFRQAIHIDRNIYIAYAGLGELHFREEEIEYARQYFRQAISINPSPAVLNRYAATFNRRDASSEELLKALRIYDSAVETHPLNLQARHQRADVLLRLGRLQEAQDELLQLAQTSQEAMVFVTLARCQECLGRPHEAIQYYHKALVLDPRREGYIKGCVERLAADCDSGTNGV